MGDREFSCADGWCCMADDAATMERDHVWETVGDITAPLREVLGLPDDTLLDVLVRETVSRLQTLPRQVLLAERDKLMAGVERLRDALPRPLAGIITADQVVDEAVTWIAHWRNRYLLVDERDKLLTGVERLREALPLPATEPLTVDQVFGEAVTWICRGRNRDEPECLYTMAMTLRSHADGSGDGVPLVELADIYARLRQRVDGWGRSRSLSEVYFCCFLKSVLEETAKWCSDTLPDAPATGGDCGGEA